MEEYINKLLEQIRFRKAHKAIGDEIRLHIEEQISANISDGMDKETAEKKAVEDMGDPVDAGIALDKVHRPQVAYGVIIIAIALGILGVIVNVLLHRFDATDCYDSQILVFPVFLFHGIIDSAVIYILGALCGIIVMLLLYLIDYTTVAKYSKVAAITILVSGAIAAFINYKYEMHMNMLYTMRKAYIGYYYDTPLWYTWGNKIFGWSHTMFFCMVPIFAGILYKFRGQKSRAVSKAILLIIATSAIAFKLIGIYDAAVIAICMLVELTIAIKKEWIKIPKVPTLISIWSLFTVGPAVLIWYIYKNLDFFHQKGLVGLDEMQSFKSGLTAYDSGEAGRILSGMKLIGSSRISSFGGRYTIPASNLVHGGGRSVLIDMVALWGLLVSVVAIIAVSALIVYGFVTVSKTKNQLGIVMGSGSMMWLAVNTICNVFYEFGILPGVCSDSIFPFISLCNPIASYALLGIILSIYKYKNAYSQHVDISIRSKLVKSKTTE